MSSSHFHDGKEQMPSMQAEPFPGSQLLTVQACNGHLSPGGQCFTTRPKCGQCPQGLEFLDSVKT